MNYSKQGSISPHAYQESISPVVLMFWLAKKYRATFWQHSSLDFGNRYKLLKDSGPLVFTNQLNNTWLQYPAYNQLENKPIIKSSLILKILINYSVLIKTRVIYLIATLNQGSTVRIGHSRLKVWSQVAVQVHYLAAVPKTKIIW